MSGTPDSESPRGPLSGVTVVDLTTSYAGPTTTMYLADLGATVLKIERPDRGDDARAWGPPFSDGASAWFASANRNKRSVAVNIRHADGLEALYALLDQADVFIQNVNPAKLAKLGIDPDTVAARFPRLVYCALSGFGLDGPDRDRPGYDLIAQARSGIMSVTGARGGSPQRVSTALTDIGAGMSAAIAICAALRHQTATGEGEVIDVSLLETGLALMAPRIAAFQAGGPEPEPSGATDSVLAVYQSFATADRDIAVGVGNDAMWRQFCLAIDRPDLGDDPRFADSAGRLEHRETILAEVAERLRGASAEHWMARFTDQAIPATLVQSLSEVVTDSQVVAREAVMPVPGHSDLSSVRPPFRLASQREVRNDCFPDLGEATVSSLRAAGYSEDRIERLLADGVVSAPTQSSSRSGG